MINTEGRRRKIPLGSDFDIFDMIFNRVESFFLGRDLKHICKELKVPPEGVKLYLASQKDLLKAVNKENVSKEIKKEQTMEEGCFPTVIRHRLFELHQEFLPNISTKFKHSTNGLVRQVIELYIVTLYCRIHPEFRTVIIERKEERFENVAGKIKEIKEAHIKVSYIPERISTDEFLDTVHNNFKMYSNLFHPSPRSLAKDIFHSEPDESGDRAIIIPIKDIPVSPDESNAALYTFYVYTRLIIQELEMADK